MNLELRLLIRSIIIFILGKPLRIIIYFPNNDSIGIIFVKRELKSIFDDNK